MFESDNFFRPFVLVLFYFLRRVIRFLINISTCLKATLHVRSAYDGDKRKYRLRLVDYIFSAWEIFHWIFIHKEIILKYKLIPRT
jgi:hypothetical protein